MPLIRLSNKKSRQRVLICYLFLITGSNMPYRTPGRLLQACPTLLSFIGCCCLVTPLKLVPKGTSLHTCIPSISASGYGCIIVIIIEGRGLSLDCIEEGGCIDFTNHFVYNKLLTQLPLYMNWHKWRNNHLSSAIDRRPFLPTYLLWRVGNNKSSITLLEVFK